MPTMKKRFCCPECGEPTSVLRTKRPLPQRIVRYRECENGHKFSTTETTLDQPATKGNAIGTTNVQFALLEFMKQLGIDSDSSSTATPENEN